MIEDNGANCRMGRPAKSFSHASLFALAVASCLSASDAKAQSFQADPNVVLGGAIITTSATTTDIEVGTPEAVIDWYTFDPDTTSTTPIDFQLAGTTATFRDGSAILGTNYRVLNRIIENIESGTPLTRSVQFNGTVQSLIGNSTGGEIWFYSPVGIIAGPSAVFNVGSLLLTTNDIDFSDRLLLGANGEVRFRGPADSTGFVDVAPGAQLNALGGNSAYIGLVAPYVVQNGTVQSDGAVAYVAAEQADITFNAGLVDILVSVGTTDPNGIDHSGTTGGPQSQGSADPQQIYMVAVPKNNALTMLLSGTIGYVPATSATNEGSAVVLSAGQGLGFDTSPVSADLGNIDISDALFTSPVTATASNIINVFPVDGTDVIFQSSADLYGANAVNLTAFEGSRILADSLIATSAENLPGGDGGQINLYAEGDPLNPSSIPGQIGVTNTMTLLARSFPSFSDANPDNVGGFISAVALGGSISAGQLYASADAIGSDALQGPVGGSGTGGSIRFFAINGGTFDTGAMELSAFGYGSQGALPNDFGGDGTGGKIFFGVYGGSVIAASLRADVTGVGGVGTIAGGNGTVTVPTDDSGAEFPAIEFVLNNGGSMTIDGNAVLQAGALGGFSTGTSGNAIGGDIGLTIDGASFSSNRLAIDSFTVGGDGGADGGNGTGGDIAISLTNGGSLNTSTLVQILSLGAGGGGTTTGGDGAGGSIVLTVSDAVLSAASFYAESSGYQGINISDPAVTSSIGTAGTVAISTSGTGGLDISGDFSAFSFGSVPTAGKGVMVSLSGADVTIGGSANLFATDDVEFGFDGGATFRAANDLLVSAENIRIGTASLTNGELVAGNMLDLNAGDTVEVNTPAYGANVTTGSQDIIIGSTGELGRRGVTSGVTLFNYNLDGSYFIGGSGQPGEFSVDTSEVNRIFADESISFVAQSDGVAQDVFVGDMSVPFGPSGNIGEGGIFGVFTDGNVIVDGNALFSTVSATDTFSVNAARFDIVTDSGSLIMSDVDGLAGGTADIFAGTVAVGTSDTLGQLGGGTLTTAQITALLDSPQAVSGPGGFFQAGTIAVNVTDGFFVQNSGPSTAYADRLGFSANTVAITTQSADTIISINGVTFDSFGSPVSGLDTEATVMINGAPAASGGQFDPLSTINGCIIGSDCRIPEVPPEITLRKPEIKEKVTTIDPAIDILPGIEVTEAEPDQLLPLVDEPVTGVGNDDLWEDSCSADSDQCSQGEGS